MVNFQEKENYQDLLKKQSPGQIKNTWGNGEMVKELPSGKESRVSG